jgi:Spy/CpxP family protein refolding chaperone
MTKKRALMAALTAITLGASVPAIVLADCQKAMSPAEREKKLDQMATDLKLTQDQKNQIRTIKDDKHQKMEAAMQDAQDRIRSVLTPEQQVKFDKMLADKKD